MEASCPDHTVRAVQSLSESPPPHSSRSYGSIWKRSKEILGLDRYEFLQNNYADEPTKTNPKNDANGSENTAVKRREQVRRAQKKHRARTEAYIKALEQEVVRLQKVETENATLNQGLLLNRRYIKELEKKLVGLQKESMSSIQGFQMGMGAQVDRTPTAVASLLHRDGQYVLEAKMQEPYTVDNIPNSANPNSAKSPGGGDSAAQNSLNWQMLMLINPLANQQTAINFVLHLEEQCMQHLKGHIAKSNGSSVLGHALTATACLVSQSPSAKSLPSSWPISNTDIDRLFSLSSKLNLSGELTPIEAWNRIWIHPYAGSLTTEGLSLLEQNLKMLISCHGFGAVMDESRFNTVLESFFKSHAVYQYSLI